jgi:hypothetical protein
MSIPTYRLTQRPDHVVHKGDTILIGDEPHTVTGVAPVPAEGVFLDWDHRIESNVVVLTVEKVKEAADG